MEEDDETFFVNLTDTIHAQLIFTQAVCMILDYDLASTLSIENATVSEGDDGSVSAVFTVTLSHNPWWNSVTVDYATADGTATAPEDYQSISGSLEFPLFIDTGYITVTVNNDLLDEEDEIFYVNLSNPENAEIDDGQASGTILDYNTEPELFDWGCDGYRRRQQNGNCRFSCHTYKI